MPTSLKAWHLNLQPLTKREIMHMATGTQFEKLEKIKTCIREERDYFRDNYRRYQEFRNFVFRTSLSEADRQLFKLLSKPQIEFNIMEAYISRLRGEFSKQEPSLSMRSSDGVDNLDPALIELIDGYLRHIIFSSNKDNMEYDIYTDVLSGGFSCMKVYTEYVNEMSMDQNICIGRVFDPTLTGFDKAARISHQGDGKFAFEIYPKTRDDVESEYGSKYVKDLKFMRDAGNSIGGFNWSYKNSNEDVMMVADYYEKKIIKGKIVRLTDNSVMTVKDYDKFSESFVYNSIEQPPVPVGKPRDTEFVTIDRYIITEKDIIDKQSTDFKYLPLVFVDGNSVILRKQDGGPAEQFCRPYVYHAKGVQQLKNFAGVTLANELENLVQHKFVVSKEAIPEDYLEAYENVQKANVLIYNQFYKGDPQMRLDPPNAVPRVPIPQEITSTFSMADQVTQAILGSYDASLGINNNQLSGVAITEGATQSNASAIRYIVRYLKAWNQV